MRLPKMLYPKRIAKKQASKLVVKPHISVQQKVALWAVGAVVVIAAVYGAYRYGLHIAGFKATEAARTQQRLERQVAKLERTNADMRDTTIQAQRQLQVDKTAYHELDAALQDSTSKLADLREELNFYRNIMSPSDDQRGLKIQGLKIQSSGVPDHYRYKLILYQALDQRNPIRGRVAIHLVGVQDGASKTIEIKDSDSDSMSLNFRYFQNVEGVIILPEGFTPTRVKIDVSSNDRQKPHLEKWYPWAPA